MTTTTDLSEALLALYESTTGQSPEAGKLDRAVEALACDLGEEDWDAVVEHGERFE